MGMGWGSCCIETWGVSLLFDDEIQTVFFLFLSALAFYFQRLLVFVFPPSPSLSDEFEEVFPATKENHTISSPLSWLQLFPIASVSQCVVPCPWEFRSTYGVG
jgi:hypothetical protein